MQDIIQGPKMFNIQKSQSIRLLKSVKTSEKTELPLSVFQEIQRIKPRWKDGESKRKYLDSKRKDTKSRCKVLR